MTLPTNLFIDTPEVEDLSMTRLGTDTTEWPGEIIAKLKERIPLTATMSLSLKFMHKNDEVGAATGSITITNGQMTGVVPVVIKEFQLYPLDLFMFQGRMLPLNPDSFAAVFMPGTESPFGRLDEYPMLTTIDRYLRGETLQNAIFPPNWGRYSFASDKSSMLDEINGSVDGSNYFKKASSDHGAIARMWTNGTLEILKKTANLHPVNMNEFRQGVDKLVTRTIHVLKKEGPNRYTLLSNSRDTFNPALSVMDRLEANGFCSKVSDKPTSILHDVDQNGEKVIIVEDDSESSVFLGKPKTDEIVPANQYGLYNIRTNKTGVNVEGLVIPTVIDFDQNPVDYKLFLGKTTSTIQQNLFGTKITTSQWKPPSSSPKVGETGTFVYRTDKGAVGTVPVTIKSIHKFEDYCPPTETPRAPSFSVTATDLSGKQFKLCVSGDMHLERIANLGDRYLIPGRMEWIPMEGFEDMSSSPYEYAVKTAAEKLSANPAILMSTSYNEWSIRGAQKYASAINSDPSRLQSHEAKFILASMGVGEEKIAQAMKTAKVKGSVEIHNVRYPELWSEKVASFIPKATDLLKKAEALRNDFLKVASYVENAQTVDSLLSLNFITADNITKFVSKIPLFKAALSNLAACLLASRLGIKEIPEQSAMSAISKIGEVIKGLEILRATQAVPKKK